MVEKEKGDKQLYSGIPVEGNSFSFASSVQRRTSKACITVPLSAQKSFLSTSSVIPFSLYASSEMKRLFGGSCAWKAKGALTCRSSPLPSSHRVCSLCASMRFVSSSSSTFAESDSFSTPQELFHFFHRYKMWHSKEQSQQKKSAMEKKSSKGTLSNAEVPSEEALRRAMDRFLSWSASPDMKAPPLVKLACEVAFSAGWSQRSCEMFFSSFPIEILDLYIARLQQDQGSRSPLFSSISAEASISTETSDDTEEEEKIGRKNSGSVGNESTEAKVMPKTASTYPITPGVEVESELAQLSLFEDLLASLPSEVIQSAIHFFQVEELPPTAEQGNPMRYREGMVATPSSDHGAACSPSSFSYSSARYIYQCLVVAHLLTSQSATTTAHASRECSEGSCGQGSPATRPSLGGALLRADSKERGSNVEKLVGSGKTIALRMHFYALWEIVRKEKEGLQLKFRTSRQHPFHLHQRTCQQNEPRGRSQSFSCISLEKDALTASSHSSSAGAEEGQQTSGSSNKVRNHEEREKRRVRFLRHVANTAAAIFGVQQHDWSPSTIACGFEGFINSSQEKEMLDSSFLREEDDVIEASLRLLRYRWSAFVVQNTVSLSESSILLDDGKRSLASGKTPPSVLPFSYPEFPSPQVEEKILSDALASLCVRLFRVYMMQEGVTAVIKRNKRVHETALQRVWSPRSTPHVNGRSTRLTEKREHSRILVSMNPEVSCFLFKVVIASRRWDLGDYLTLLLDQYWYSRFGDTHEKVAAGTLLSHSDSITASEEDLLHQQARYYMFSRQFLRALEWWSWLGSLGTASTTAVTDRKDAVSAIAPGSRPNAFLLPFYPVPHIPLLATLARIAGEFATMNDYYISLRSSSRDCSSTSFFQKNFQRGETENKVRFYDPAALALWCLETMLHSQQSSPPTGNALFLAVTACAKSGLPVLDQVLQSLVENQVLALTDEEVLHVRLLHCRRDIHWRERLEAFVPLVAQMPPLPAPLSSTACRRRAVQHIEFSPSPEAFPLPHSSSTRIKKDLSNKSINTSREKKQPPVSVGSSTVYGAANAASVASTSMMLSNSFFFSLPIQGVIGAFSGAGLSARNVFRILLLLQEGNDSRFLPFYLYVRYIFALPSPSVFPSPPSPSPVSPLSRDQECRWLLLALTYTAANAKAVPKEWVWRVASEALRHLQYGLSSQSSTTTVFSADKIGEESSIDWMQDNDSVDEAHVEKEEQRQKKSEEKGDAASLSLFLSSASRSSDAHLNHYPFIPSPDSNTSIAPDTWRSLQRKWAAFRNQYSDTFWESFLETYAKKNSIKNSSSRVRSMTHVSAAMPPESSLRQEEDVVQVEWVHLLQLPSFTLLPRTCRTYLRVERQTNYPSSRRSRENESTTNVSSTAVQSVEESVRFLAKKGKLHHLPIRGCFPDADMMFEQATHFVSSTSRGDVHRSVSFLLRNEWQSSWLSS